MTHPGCKVFVTALVTLVAACDSAEAPSERFYFPVAELSQGLAYVYEGTGEQPGPTHYWYYRSVETMDSAVLVSTFYDAALEPRQLMRERIVRSGSLLRDLRLYLPTDSGSVVTAAEILQPAMFSFDPPDTSRLLISVVRFTEPTGGHPVDSFRQNPPRASYTITRNRRYRRDTTYAFAGQTLPAQLWTVRELTEQDSVGTLAIESAAVEIYAEGIGLVYRERRFANGTGEAHRLTERVPMDSLAARFARTQPR